MKQNNTVSFLRARLPLSIVCLYSFPPFFTQPKQKKGQQAPQQEPEQSPARPPTTTTTTTTSPTQHAVVASGSNKSKTIGPLLASDGQAIVRHLPVPIKGDATAGQSRTTTTGVWSFSFSFLAVCLTNKSTHACSRLTSPACCTAWARTALSRTTPSAFICTKSSKVSVFFEVSCRVYVLLFVSFLR